MKEKPNPSDIVVTIKNCNVVNKIFPTGSYMEVEKVTTSSNGSIHTKCLGSARIFLESEIELVKTFKLGDAVNITDTINELSIRKDAVWVVSKVFIEDRKLYYEVKRRGEKLKVQHYQVRRSHNESSLGVNKIRKFDDVIVLKENDEHYKHHHEIMTVEDVNNIGGIISYKLKGCMFIYGEKDIRLWETKDEIVRAKFYTLSKMMRQNTYRLADIHCDYEWCELTQKQIKEHFDYLKKVYKKFIDERIFTEETINILNTMYKQAKTKKQIIECRIKEQKEVEDSI